MFDFIIVVLCVITTAWNILAPNIITSGIISGLALMFFAFPSGVVRETLSSIWPQLTFLLIVLFFIAFCLSV